MIGRAAVTFAFIAVGSVVLWILEGRPAVHGKNVMFALVFAFVASVLIELKYAANRRQNERLLEKHRIGKTFE